jgi:hypothetical protein
MTGRPSLAVLGFTAFTLAAGLGACSSGGSSNSGAAGGGGATATGGSGGSGETTGAGGRGGGGGAAGSGGGAFVNAGACGERGMATATATGYDGTAEFYIIGEAGLGVDVCVVSFDVERSGAAPAGCMDPTTSAACAWAHTVAFSNPTIVTNVGGACDASDSVPQLDAAGRAQIAAATVGRGFSKVAGHGDSLMKYDGSKWTVVGHASWDEASSQFGYDIRTGNCNYGR